eukprot:5899819-Prymnesium_polylepis.1
MAATARPAASSRLPPRDDENLDPGSPGLRRPVRFTRRQGMQKPSVEDEEPPSVETMQGLLLTHEQHIKQAGPNATVDANIHAWHLANCMHFV